MEYFGAPFDIFPHIGELLGVSSSNGHSNILNSSMRFSLNLKLLSAVGDVGNLFLVHILTIEEQP